MLAVLFVVFTTPSIVIAPRKQLFLKGNTVVLFCNASGFPKPSISWRKAGNSTVISMANTLTFSHTTIKDVGSYVCTASNHMGTVSAAASIDVHCKYNLLVVVF